MGDWGSTWETVFTDPEDPDWTIQSYGQGHYAMNHNCNGKWTGGRGWLIQRGDCCGSCGAKFNAEFQGFYNLVKYGAENG